MYVKCVLIQNELSMQESESINVKYAKGHSIFKLRYSSHTIIDGYIRIGMTGIRRTLMQQEQVCSQGTMLITRLCRRRPWAEGGKSEEHPRGCIYSRMGGLAPPLVREVGVSTSVCVCVCVAGDMCCWYVCRVVYVSVCECICSCFSAYVCV